MKTHYVYLILFNDRLVDIIASTQSQPQFALEYWIESHCTLYGTYSIATWVRGSKTYSRGDIQIEFSTTVYTEI